MTRKEAYQAMLDGHKVKHYYYSENEYAFINKNGIIETEDGCRHGGRLDEFWESYQTWEEDWSIVEGDGITVDSLPQDLGKFKITKQGNMNNLTSFSVEESLQYLQTLDKDEQVKYMKEVISQHQYVNRTPILREGKKIHRNEPCPCESGKKFKKCCINKTEDEV